MLDRSTDRIMMVAVVAFAIEIAVFFAPGVVHPSATATTNTTEPVEIIDEQTAVTKFAEAAGLTDEDRMVLIASAAESNMTVSHRVGNPKSIIVDGYGSKVVKNLKRDYSFECSYDWVDGSWIPHDWTWSVVPEIAARAGWYRTPTDNNSYYMMWLEYYEPTTGYIGVEPIFQFFEVRNGRKIWESGITDYNGTDFGDGCAIFMFNDGGERRDLMVFYDGSMQYDGKDLEFWTSDNRPPAKIIDSNAMEAA